MDGLELLYFDLGRSLGIWLGDLWASEDRGEGGELDGQIACSRRGGVAAYSAEMTTSSLRSTERDRRG